MKYLKYIGLLTVLILVGYIILSFIQKKNFEKQVQINGENHVVEVFNNLSKENKFKFSSFAEAKNILITRSGEDNIKDFQIYRWKDIVSLNAILDKGKNVCKVIELNLITGFFSSKETACIIFDGENLQ